MFKRILKWSVLSILGLFIIIQFIPYGHAHSRFASDDRRQ